MALTLEDLEAHFDDYLAWMNDEERRDLETWLYVEQMLELAAQAIQQECIARSEHQAKMKKSITLY